MVEPSRLSQRHPIIWVCFDTPLEILIWVGQSDLCLGLHSRLTGLGLSIHDCSCFRRDLFVVRTPLIHVLAGHTERQKKPHEKSQVCRLRSFVCSLLNVSTCQVSLSILSISPNSKLLRAEAHSADIQPITAALFVGVSTSVPAPCVGCFSASARPLSSEMALGGLP